ncbi:MAG TPA: type II toxin-antitoxin system VapC family toxin [Firmicutes bacterium]|nr:type II toxin-antitoxin system VapC family toxin [Candidatus Fermentithermobacillaceae bacterium]
MPEPARETAFVMDSTALLAFLRGEPGGRLVQRVLRQCEECGTQVEITADCLLEVYASGISGESASLEELASLIDQLPLAVAPLTQDLAIQSARILASSPGMRPAGASSVALSREAGTTLVTADPLLASMVPSLYVGPRQDEGNGGELPEFTRGAQG